ncbi:MAG: phosphate signaling complex protein PhoU [Bacillota bacterium]
MNSTRRKAFHEDMRTLKATLMEMVDAIIDIYDDMFSAIRHMDIPLSKTIMENDSAINTLERRINEQATLLIMKQCPVASDLRFIIAALKIANDLERLGDYASNNALYVVKTTRDNSSFRPQFLEYSEPLKTMFYAMREAVVKGDVEAAEKVCDLDSNVDEIYQRHVVEFIQISAKESGTNAHEAARALLVIKQLERAGDHLTNIGEEVIYLSHGQIITLN